MIVLKVVSFATFAKIARPASLCAAILLSALPVSAQISIPAPQVAARSWLLLDVSSNQLLGASEPDQKLEPASLTKLMTAYLVFTAVKEKRLTLDQKPPVSEAAYKAIGSRMFVDRATPASVEQLMNGMIIQSGNDAAIILAEAIAGTEADFAKLMNVQAQKLGLTNTSFKNATGLPDTQHFSTARDMASLAQRIIADFPEFYPIYAKKEYRYNNISQANRNNLLFVDPTVDGVKTGRTDAAGYCLVASAKRGDRRLISVVMGTVSETARAIESQRLLNHGFQNFEIAKLFQGTGVAAAAGTTAGQSQISQTNQTVGTYRVWKGQTNEVKGVVPGGIIVSVPKGRSDAIKAEIERIQPLIAPLAVGQKIGVVRVKLDDKIIAERPLLAEKPVEQAGIFGRLWDTVQLWVKKD
jgi:serine-type D-Ala-D-Ala carboxypeptidase (penicillin-binding protein 5/6)